MYGKPLSRWRGLMVGVASAAFLLADCNSSQPNDQQVQQRAAETTAALKQGAKEAASATQAAAGIAEKKMGDVAIGVKQGLHESAPRVDLNSASQIRLATLPGISFSKAGDIVKGRPYRATHQLVSRSLLTQAQFAKIETQVTTLHANE